MIIDSLGLVALAMGAGAGRTPLSPAPATFLKSRIAQFSTASSREASLKMNLSHARTVKAINQLTKGDAR